MKTTTKKGLYAIVIVAWIALSIFVWVRIFDGMSNIQPATADEVPASPMNLDIQLGEDTRVTGIKVGSRSKAGQNLETFVPQQSIAIEPGRLVGWVAWLETDLTEVSWTEIFHYREQVQVNQLPDYSQLDRENRRIISAQSQPIFEGLIGHFWEVTDEDVPGQYRFEISIEDTAIATLDFSLESP